MSEPSSRPPDAALQLELQRCIDDPGFTPKSARLGALVHGLASLDEERAQKVVRALARSGLPAAHAALAELGFAKEPARLQLLGLVSRVATQTHDAGLLSPLISALQDPALRCRKAAASALGKLGDIRAEPALVAALRGAPLELQRVIVEALGKVGGEAAREALAQVTRDDAELARRVSTAEVLLQRRSRRGETSRILLDRTLPARARVQLLCRRGLSEILVGELPVSAGALALDAERVELEHDGTLGELLLSRTALEFALAIPLNATLPSLEARVVEAISRSETLRCLQAWTEGVPRVRFEWAGAGHKRSLSWSVARSLAAVTQELVNDPRAASWTARLRGEGSPDLLLIPKLDPDPRFAYRQRDVPAASHPTVAAALARVAGVRVDDVVWDPFVGSGLELVERARLGAYERLVGSDLDTRALAAARSNLEAAAIERFELIAGDARSLCPEGVTLILCNPPMGRRVARDGSLIGLLEGFVQHVGSMLSPNARMVWLSPLAARTARIARSAGLEVEEGPRVDLGGFEAQVQLFRRPG